MQIRSRPTVNWLPVTENCWVIMLPTLSSLLALHIVVMTICVAISDTKVDLMHKSYKSPVPYSIAHHFVAETFLCFRCPCTYPPITTRPQPSPPPPPPPHPNQSVYHACTHFRKKRSGFSMGGANLLNPKKEIIFQAWIREQGKILHVFIFISLFRVWIVMHKCIWALTIHWK